jgi:hypothetical protein
MGHGSSMSNGLMEPFGPEKMSLVAGFKLHQVFEYMI